MLEADTIRAMSVINNRGLFGRRRIVLDYSVIDSSNIIEAFGKACAVHEANAREIEYLWQYYKGNQPILNRVKEIRPEINNKIAVNVANEIVSFKVGYQVGEPIQYIARTDKSSIMNGVMKLNDFMFAEDKASQDQEIVEWQTICGTAYRMVLPDASGDEDESPFEIYTTEPEDTFVAYTTDLGNRPIMGAIRRKHNGQTEWSVYTENMFYLIREGEIQESQPHAYGMVPIFEYPANHARLGAFEIVLPLLDALNNVMSNRMDGVEQEIQAFIKFINCDIDEEDFKALKELGAIKVKSVQGQSADVDVVKTELNQDQTQTLKDDIYQSILTICGMPNRNGGSSTSDTGSAVIFRDGWETAESRAKDFEHTFKRSEKQMLKLVLRICNELAGTGLRLADIDMKFTRRNYENIQSKSQVLCQMLGTARIHPKLAFEHCGMFSDAETAYEMSEEYYNNQLSQWQVTTDEDDSANVNGGHDEDNMPNDETEDNSTEKSGDEE